MFTTGFPMLVTQKRVQSDAADLRREMDLVRQETIDGRVADLTGELGSDVGKVQSIERQIDEIDQRLTDVDLIKADLGFVQQTMNRLSTAANRFATEIEVALGQDNTEAIEALEAEVETELRLAFSALNTSFGGRQLFSGAATDTPPLAQVEEFISDVVAITNTEQTSADVTAKLNDYFTNTGLNTWDGAIYQGSTVAGPDREINANKRIGVTINATDDAFKELFRGLATFIAAKHAPEGEQEAVRLAAAKDMRDGAKLLIDQQTRIGANEAAVTEAETILNSEKQIYQELLAGYTTVDQFEAASRLTSLETQLQAIYLTTSRLQSLSLVNFLR